MPSASLLTYPRGIIAEAVANTKTICILVHRDPLSVNCRPMPSRHDAWFIRVRLKPRQLLLLVTIDELGMTHFHWTLRRVRT